MKEFDVIKKYFTPLSNREDVIVGVGDDCAILQPPVDQQLAMTVDTLVAGIHFPEKTSAYDIGYKSLAVSLSDIAAVGAEPAWVMLSLVMQEAKEKWVKEFCEGFHVLLDKFSLSLIGGNIAHGELQITTQVTGFLSPGRGLFRHHAKAGDLIYVTGTLGDAALALKGLQKKIKLSSETQEEILPCLNRPQPRVEEGLLLRDLANAAIDISDGLAADLGHLLEASNVGATIKTERLPLSKILRTCVSPEEAWQLALAGGDDYELCFTLPPERQGEFELRFGSFDCGYICIGKIEEQPGLRILDPQGKEFTIKSKGYEHYV